jgi:hypothetical protein
MLQKILKGYTFFIIFIYLVLFIFTNFLWKHSEGFMGIGYGFPAIYKSRMCSDVIYDINDHIECTDYVDLTKLYYNFFIWISFLGVSYLPVFIFKNLSGLKK